METSLTDWRRRALMYSQELQHFLFSIICKMIATFKAWLLCNAAAHMSHAAAGTCCPSPQRHLPRLWTSTLAKSFLGELLSYKETEPVRILLSKRWRPAASLPAARSNNLVYIDKMSTAVSGESFYVFFFNSAEEICRCIMQMNCFWPGRTVTQTQLRTYMGDAKKTWWSWFW